ncbi:DUF222 domain-containing protein [Gordonia sp. NPDC003585]|uniref:HNH endonuclease n=1 Tax=Gordonia sp. NPDC003585 TaxID=3154275 RepID=UPI0033AA6D53
MPTTTAPAPNTDSPQVADAQLLDPEGYLQVLTAIRAALWDLPPGGTTPSGRQAHTAMTLLIELRAILDHHAATTAATLDRLGVARHTTSKTSALLIAMGVAPAVAHRWLRIGTAQTPTSRLPGYTADGAISGEHADAIIGGIAHIGRRAPDGICDEERADIEHTLIAQAMSGATPADIATKSRELGNTYAITAAGVPPGEDRTINEFTVTPTNGGRVAVRGDLDTVTGEKLTAAIESLNTPRPEPDGSDDARTQGARNADALELILDAAAVADTTLATPPTTQVSVLLPATAPDKASLQCLGPISPTTASLLTCDSTVTDVVIDGETVPLQMGTSKRLFPAHLRRAIIIRDHCCIKCGAPAGRTHVHHITFWSHGGPTDLDNGCLLCPSCHAYIHASDWDIIMGADRHPWLVPPATIDPRRTPLPAYNRRTMTLDDRIAA